MHKNVIEGIFDPWSLEHLLDFQMLYIIVGAEILLKEYLIPKHLLDFQIFYINVGADKIITHATWQNQTNLSLSNSLIHVHYGIIQN